ncbi:MAG TPA: excinuclease ABC subunit UvrC [Candidatus Limnocylindrales bacterium]|jgi:excinuclease ABC subunit C|nr:excinuclease ABC subunit UvrC [Candidatus Limnocylindrales bacterium]
MTPQLQATLAKLPTQPGVYLMKDARGQVLYVGRAQNLRNRVRQYWQKGRAQQPLRIETSIERVADVEYTVTDTVSEALLLEATLVKRHQPRFNVRLKDDKSYPYIRITLADDFPRIERTRRLPNDGSRYFGPYASASSVDESMNLIRRLFPFRTCTLDIRDGQRALARPCLLYHIKRCQGPCIEAVSKADYRADIEQVMLFLEGRQEQVVRRLEEEMLLASEATDFERAAALRDKLRAVERTMESQKMAAFARADSDVLGYAREGNGAAVQLFAIRGGKTVVRDVFMLENVGDASDDEALGAFVRQYYAATSSVPPRVLLPRQLPDADELRQLLETRRGRRVSISVPQRGEGRALMDLAGRNAAETLARDQARWLADQGKTLAALEQLAEALGLAAPPMRIECYDISTIQGTNTVGSMVVFEEGRPRSGEYRRFRVRTAQVAAGRPDDYASHAEVLRRRFFRALEGEEGSAEELRWRLPDLVVIDGGLGQANIARRALDELGLHEMPIVGLAKEREELWLPGAAVPLILPRTSQALYLMQRIRDEAHRFAVTYHRQLRAKAQTRSALDEMPGIGPARKRALLRVFGSTRQLRRASVDEIAAVPGISRTLALRIHETLNA